MLISDKTVMPEDPREHILITIDLEDWFQVENLRPCYPHERWDSCELRVERNTYRILELFDHHQIEATFFVLGWIAEKCPDLIRNIHNHGHEIASHGFDHRLCSAVTLQALREDIKRSKSMLEDITGQAVRGYRAPSFSITEKLVETLGDLGFTYDSSYNDFSLNERYGRAEGVFNYSETGLPVTKNGLAELPMSNLNIFGRVVPWSGGGYFRFWPSTVFRSGVNLILRRNNYYMLYLHPWEIDYEQPRERSIGLISYFRHYLNLRDTLNRLDTFITYFKGRKFVSCSKYLLAR